MTRINRLIQTCASVSLVLFFLFNAIMPIQAVAAQRPPDVAGTSFLSGDHQISSSKSNNGSFLKNSSPNPAGLLAYPDNQIVSTPSATDLSVETPAITDTSTDTPTPPLFPTPSSSSTETPVPPTTISPNQTSPVTSTLTDTLIPTAVSTATTPSTSTSTTVPTSTATVPPTSTPTAAWTPTPTSTNINSA